MRVFFFHLILLGFFSSFYSQAEVKTHMDIMIQQIFNLKPYIVSPHEYSKGVNQKVISSALSKTISTAEKVHGTEAIKDTPLELSASRLLQQLRSSESAFQNGSKDYSLWLLRTSLANCLACHTQSASGSTQFKTENKAGPLYNSFQEAEFLFLARNYDDALKLYTKAIGQYPSAKITWADVEQSLFRKIYYFVRVKRDLPALTMSLDADLKNKNLSGPLLQLFKDYRNAAQSVQGPAFPTFSSADTAQLKKFSETILKEEIQGKFPKETAGSIIDSLRLSAVLYDYLKANPNTELQPDIYYWLSLCENHPRQFSFDFLSEMYLKKCVAKFPKSSVAPKCLVEYKNLVTQAYTGDSGAPLPELINQELKSMENLMQELKQ